jgi:predicted enzyme related to lactoylglutathione lyase
MADGRVGHAELAVGDTVLMLAEEFPEFGNVVAPRGGPLIRVELPDVDAAAVRTVEVGTESVQPVQDRGYGRGGTIKDAFGQRWLVAQATPNGDENVPEGQAVYFTFQVPDHAPARDFYGAVLGWRFSPGSVEGGWRIEGNGLDGGLWGGPGRQVGWKLMYAVDDLDAALARVTELGGRAGEPETMPYGISADCVDNQGIGFWLLQPPRE